MRLQDKPYQYRNTKTERIIYRDEPLPAVYAPWVRHYPEPAEQPVEAEACANAFCGDLIEHTAHTDPLSPDDVERLTPISAPPGACVRLECHVLGEPLHEAHEAGELERKWIKPTEFVEQTYETNVDAALDVAAISDAPADSDAGALVAGDAPAQVGAVFAPPPPSGTVETAPPSGTVEAPPKRAPRKATPR